VVKAVFKIMTEDNSNDTTNQNPETQAEQDLRASGGKGVFGKPIIEQLKLLAVFVALGIILYFSRPTPLSFGIGSVFVVIGTLIRIWAGGHLTRDQRLTTSGPYQYTRNPFYLGRLLWIIGFAIMAGIGGELSEPRVIVIWAVLIVSIFVFFAYYMPRKEAREGGRLAKLFPDDYVRWKENVPSLFPRLTPYVMNPRPWNKDLYMGNSAEYMGNKEVWTTLVVVVLIVLFYVRMVVPR
jgi:protein-S-isoprenylcysteine O-methyltransferase Ste14